MAWIVCMLGATSLLNTAMEKADAQHVVPIYFAVQVHHSSFLSIRLPAQSSVTACAKSGRRQSAPFRRGSSSAPLLDRLQWAVSAVSQH